MHQALRIGLLVAWASLPAQALTYYVDYSAGSDLNTGLLPATPFKRCPGDSSAAGVAALTVLLPGDTVIFKGGVAYSGMITLDRSGSAGAPLVYDGNSAGTYGTGRAIINNQNATSITTAFIAPVPKSFITLRNFDITELGGYPDNIASNGCTTPISSGGGGCGVNFTAGGNNLRMENMSFREIGEWRNKDPFADGAIGGSGIALQNVTNVVVDGCEFTRMSIGVSVKVNVTAIRDIEIKNCDFHNYLRWCVDIAPRASGCAIDNIRIHDSLIHDYFEYDSANWRGCGEKPHTDGIFVRSDYDFTAWGSIKIYNNEFYSTNNNGGGTACIYITEGPSADVYNNTFINTLHGRTVYLNNGPRNGSSPQFVRIYNNTFFNNRTAVNLQRQTTNAPVIGDVRIMNNIFCDTRTGSGNNFAVFMEDVLSVPDVMDYNLYTSFNTFNLLIRWNGGGGEMTMAQMKAQGWELHGLVGDPWFVDVTKGVGPLGYQNDLHLQGLSPAVGTATNLSSVLTLDKDGAARSAPWEMGVYEQGGAVSGTPMPPTGFHVVPLP